MNQLKTSLTRPSKDIGKTVFPITKTLHCPRCRHVVAHTLYDYDYAIYKCTYCGNIHV